MRLLVSVADAADARAAVEGGADIVDAKDPSRGSLGAVAPTTLEAIVQAVGGARPLSAAVGDAQVTRPDADPARALLGLIAVAPGLAFIKMGFGPGLGRLRAMAHAAAAVDAAYAASCGVVLAGYADGSPDHLTCDEVIDIALRSGAVGVLIDTLEKPPSMGGEISRGLFAKVGAAALSRWIDAAHGGGLSVALAGSLGVGDVERVRDMAADIMGVRGAVCESGRESCVSVSRVRALAARVREASRRPEAGVRWPSVRDHPPDAPADEVRPAD